MSPCVPMSQPKETRIEWYRQPRCKHACTWLRLNVCCRLAFAPTQKDFSGSRIARLKYCILSWSSGLARAWYNRTSHNRTTKEVQTPSYKNRNDVGLFQIFSHPWCGGGVCGFRAVWGERTEGVWLSAFSETRWIAVRWGLIIHDY
jgi:hypothetical protein